jgi:hypothetical protein
MNWDAIGAIGEIVGAIAVIATLVFLAIQIRQSNQSQRESNVIARSEAVDRVFEQFTGFRRLLASDADVTRIWLAGCAAESLDTIDENRFFQLATDYLIIIANWEQRAGAVKMPTMRNAAVQLLIAQLRDKPGLRAVWGRIAEASSSKHLRQAVSDAFRP